MQAASSTFLCVSQSSRRIPNAPQSSRTYPKGILRSNSQGCQGCCSCEECESLRTRARNASEFSQRQMQDIETVTMKLLKGLNILRTIVEERLIQNSVNQDSQVDISLDQVKKATISALEAEKTAKKWLNRMARDCNRYCKIMRMQGRRLSFADESGGKLCHVKVFQSEL
ncbi:hypothetical protein KP509_07G010200 [Ceratopteris richardii]|nr:hypothetical protein KP509_07G010200 [Ceratopteris richardii]